MSEICGDKTRWESSRKSLFVRTVWIRGCRHVILFDEDPAAQRLKSRAGSSISKNSARKISDSLPSVKFVLAEISKYEKETLQKRLNLELRKTLSIHVIPSNLRNTNVVITPKTPSSNPFNAFQASRVSSSFHSDDYREINESDCVRSEHTHQLNEYRLNSLSDRVLCWLDLATQSEKTCRCTDLLTEKLKTDYREMLSQRSKLTAKSYSLNRSRSCDYQDKKIMEEWSKKRRHFLKTTDMGLSSLSVNTIPFPSGDLLRVTSYSEESALLTKLPLTKQRTEILKRQLHVFIPNIPKRNEDASSISSKGSSIIKPS